MQESGDPVHGGLHRMAPGYFVAALVVALLALALNGWQWLAARRFPLGERRRARDGAYAWPGVSVLKPLNGADAETRGCLESWLAQDYAGPVEVLFGAASAEDASVPLVRELLARPRTLKGHFRVCGEKHGINAKVSKLVQLAREARHEVLVISDADVAVPPDLLSELVSWLQEPGMGLVNCLYRLAAPQTAALRCEAITVNSDFWSQVLQSRMIWSMDFALGAVMGVRREWLQRAGGLEAVADHLADDFQLGQRVFRAGGRVELCPVVVDCFEPPRNWFDVWRHQVRWGRTIRVCRPGPYFLSVLNNGSVWAILAALVSVGALSATSVSAGLAGLAVALACLVGRMALALDLQRRFVQEVAWRSPWWMVPVRDLLGAAVWVASWVGNSVDWRGERYRVRCDGRLGPR